MGILGSSLGGLVSCYAIWTRPEVYSRAGCMSSSFWWNNKDFNNTILHKPIPKPSIDIYLDSGDSGESKDGMYDTIAVKNHLQSFTQKFTMEKNLFYYLAKGAQHNEKYWGERFYKPMMSLYSVKAKTIIPN